MATETVVRTTELGLTGSALLVARSAIFLAATTSVLLLAGPIITFVSDVFAMDDLEPCKRYAIEPGLKVEGAYNPTVNLRRDFFRASAGTLHGYAGPGGSHLELGVGPIELLLFVPHCQ